MSTVEDHLNPEGVIHLCPTVTDLEATTASLRSRGAEPFAGPLYVDALDITLIVIKDNSGNVLVIAQSGDWHHDPAVTAYNALNPAVRDERQRRQRATP